MIIYDAVIVLALLMIAAAIALKLPFKHQLAGKDVAYTLYLVLVWYFYLAWCWRHNGMTLGMRAWNVRLINTRAGHTITQKSPDSAQASPTWWQCGLRFASAFVSALCAGMGYLWLLIDRQHLTWHDRLSGTRLVHLIGSRPETGILPVLDTSKRKV